MNPLLILVLLNLLNQNNSPAFRKHSLLPSYLDTFKFDTLNIETIQGKLQTAANALDKVSRLNQIVRGPKALAAPAEDLSELPAAPGTAEQLAPLMQMAQGIDMKALMQNIGPIMNMLGNSQEK